MTHEDQIRPTLAEVAAFLDGSGTLCGCWFGEKPEGEIGNFWWRKYLRSALAARPTTEPVREIEALALKACNHAKAGELQLSGEALVAMGSVLRSALTQVAAGQGWIPLRIEYEPGYPEDVAFGTQRQMDRLKKWLDKHLANLAAQAAPVSPPPGAAVPMEAETAIQEEQGLSARQALRELANGVHLGHCPDAELLAQRMNALADRLDADAGTPYGWLYDWTHSSALGKPDEDYTSFTQDVKEARGRVGNRNFRPVYLAPQTPSGEAETVQQDSLDAKRWRTLVKQHEIDDDEASNGNYGRTYPKRTLTVFQDDGEDGLEPVPCDPGELTRVVDAAIAAQEKA